MCYQASETELLNMDSLGDLIVANMPSQRYSLIYVIKIIMY